MENTDAAPPAPITVPVRPATTAAGSPAQQAFRQAVQDVENLRAQLRTLRTEQAEARRRYWQQVGPAAAAVVAARRALYPPLEEALLLGYFSRLEEAQITAVLLANARSLETRFGEDEAPIIQKYTRPAGGGRGAAAARAAADEEAGGPPEFPTPSPPPDATPDPAQPPHEQAAAAARARRLTKAQRAEHAAAAAARAAQQQLEANAKTVYRQLARAHHPDLERDPAKQAARTALMQRITAAYEADDLYVLLQLLAESESNLADEAAPAEVLARYTQALRQQQTSLKNELNELKYGPLGFAGSSGKKREAELRQLKRALRDEADYVQHIGQLVAEPAGLRALLREWSAAGQVAI